MARLLQVFGFLSVLFRGATLAFQSLAIGGIVFLMVVLSRTTEDSAELRQACLRWIRRSAIALAVMQISYVLANSMILMQSADMSLRQVVGANFVLAGAIGIVSVLALLPLTYAKRSASYADLLLPAVAILVSSVMTSHSAARLEYRLPLAAFTALHQAATAAWLGGLPYLLIAVRRAPRPDFARQLSCRFSQLALVSVVVLASAGLVLGFAYVGSFKAVYGTSYGAMVAAEALRRSGNWHRHHRHSYRRFAHLASSRSGSNSRPRHRLGHLRAHVSARASLRQSFRSGSAWRDLRRPEKSIRIGSAHARILRSRPGRNASEHLRRKSLVGVQPSLGRHRCSGDGLARPRRASRSNFLGAQLAAGLLRALRISFSAQRSGDLASRPRRLLVDSCRPGSSAASFFRGARDSSGGFRMARPNGPRRFRSCSAGFSCPHCGFRRFTSHPFPQPRKSQGRSARRVESHTACGAGRNRRMVALAGASPSFRKPHSQHNGSPVAALFHSDRRRPS